MEINEFRCDTCGSIILLENEKITLKICNNTGRGTEGHIAVLHYCDYSCASDALTDNCKIRIRDSIIYHSKKYEVSYESIKDSLIRFKNLLGSIALGGEIK
jgi:hypothetical protein